MKRPPPLALRLLVSFVLSGALLWALVALDIGFSFASGFLWTGVLLSAALLTALHWGFTTALAWVLRQEGSDPLFLLFTGLAMVWNGAALWLTAAATPLDIAGFWALVMGWLAFTLLGTLSSRVLPDAGEQPDRAAP